MKKITDFEERKVSLATGKANLEPLYTFKDFPVFMGCVKTPQVQDLVADMEWQICKDTGLIQLAKLLPLNILYLNQHNDGTGQVWQDHYLAFAQFLAKYKPKHILEIGGAHDQIAKNYWAIDPTVSWTTVEPNPQNITDPRIKVIKTWFDDNFTIDESIDTVIHSHVFEHLYEPFLFIEHISKFLKKGGRHIFTFPTLLPMLERKWTNCLNFEHTVFLTEEITDYLLAKNGFKILEKQYYGHPHSVFYATEKTDVPINPPALKNNYESYKKLFTDYIDYHIEIIKELNEKIKKIDQPIYLFGAHIFSQFLLNFGLDNTKIISVLDNSQMKQGQRLYGTSFIVESPEVLKDKGEVNVILRAGSYNDEITKQLLAINEEINIW